MNTAGKVAIAAALTVAGAFLYYRNRFAIDAPADASTADVMGSGAGVGSGGALTSMLGSGNSLGAGSVSSTGPAARTATSGATSGATAATTTAAAAVTPGAASVEQVAAQTAGPANLQPSWVSPIETAWQAGGVGAVKALMAQEGVGAINAGQARATWGLSDADVGYLQQQGILSGNISPYMQ